MNQVYKKQKPDKIWRRRLYEIIFLADTPAGKAFDVALIISIILSVLVVLLDTIESINVDYRAFILILEWFFTIIFTGEYVLRILATPKPRSYLLSFFGLVDLAAILPTYISLLFPGTQILLVVRVLRLLRLFRVFKMARYVEESSILINALRASRHKITVFLLAILTICITAGSVMYLIEGTENGFTSIPTAMYWVIVTLTTVGYGDISPQTPLGQIIASLLMVMAYGILAVPTGIITYELSRSTDNQVNKVSSQSCSVCSAVGHSPDSLYCKKCGAKL
ncbi:MAG: ion transporter [Firmicutes bacterium HGW-Firmicutes-12]|jgi:voltage-gated potassium channel|nr:MAG: ion transporter [Firmicutes bacterium HGW-Firmicutes-12]